MANPIERLHSASLVVSAGVYLCYSSSSKVTTLASCVFCVLQVHECISRFHVVFGLLTDMGILPPRSHFCTQPQAGFTSGSVCFHLHVEECQPIGLRPGCSEVQRSSSPLFLESLKIAFLVFCVFCSVEKYCMRNGTMRKPSGLASQCRKRSTSRAYA